MKPVCTNRRGNPQQFVTEKQALRRGCWPVAEVAENIFGCDAGVNCKVELAEGETFETWCDDPDNRRNIGNLCLTEKQEDALVTYLETLSDTGVIEAPKP